jgi:hypothetical protein
LAGRLGSTSIFLFVFASLLFAPASALAKSAKDRSSKLEGTWFVLVHYRDVQTANPDADRWLDKVWTFEMRGSRLHWVEYPIVFFESQAGRFEAYKGNPRSRVLASWEPNASQQKEIDGGPRVNSRGSQSKSLRGNDERGWKTVGRSRVSGANVVGYHEDWSIEPTSAGYSFTMREVMGNAATGTDDGLTQYEVEEADEAGNEYRGRFDRDGTRTGRFRMTRTAPIRSLESSDEDESVNKRHLRKNANRFMRITE